jgi:hypothetical protein
VQQVKDCRSQDPDVTEAVVTVREPILACAARAYSDLLGLQQLTTLAVDEKLSSQ